MEEVHPDTVRTLTGYTIIKKIGMGGSGFVYLASNGDKQRAVKVYVEEGPASPYPPELLAFRLRSFKQEGELMRRIDHPNVATCHGYGGEAPIHFILLEHIEGVSLRRYMKEYPGGFLPQNEIIEILHQILSAIAAGHESGIVHRDIKPENVMLRNGQDIRVVVLDYGIAHDLNDPSAHHLDVALGSPSTMAPEQAQGARAGLPMDIFAAGCVLYELLTGDVPDQEGDPDGDAKAYVARRAQHKALRKDGPIHIDPDLWTIARDALMPNPNDRPSARELIAKLNKLKEPEIVEAATPSAPPGWTPTPLPTEVAPPRSFTRRIRWELLAGTAVALLMVIVFSSYFKTETSRAAAQRPNWDHVVDSTSIPAEAPVADIPPLAPEPSMPPVPPTMAETEPVARRVDAPPLTRRSPHHHSRVTVLSSVNLPDPCQYDPQDPDYETEAMCVAHRITPQQRHARCADLRRDHPELNGPHFRAFCPDR